MAYNDMHSKRAAKKSLPFLYLGIIALFGFVTYFNTLYNGFVWDDHYLILKNPFIHRPDVIKIFSQDLDNTGFAKTLFYRPLQNLSYVIDYRVWGFNPFGYHITNIFLHIVNAVMIFFLVDNIAKKKMLSFLTALFFVCHPVHYGVVTYLSGRADSLFALFFLVSFLAFIKYRKNLKIRFLLMSTSGFTLALLSKEMAVITIFIFALYDLIFNPFHCVSGKSGGTGFPLTQWNGVLRPYWACGCVLLIYAVFRAGHLFQTLPAAFPGSSFFGYIFTFPLIVGQYMGTLTAPVDLCMRKSAYLASSFLEPRCAVPLLLVTLLIVLGILLKNKKKEVSFFIFFFLFSLLPVSNIFSRINAVRADHWLYLPSIGFFFLAAYLLNSIFSSAFKGKFRNYLFMFGITLASLYSALSIRENLFWRDDITLFKEILRRRPEDRLTIGNLGMAYFAKGRFKTALLTEKELVKLHPDYAEGYYNIGVIYFGMKKIGMARDYFKKAIAKDKSLDLPYVYLGLIHKSENKLPDAEKEFMRAIEINPHSALGYVHAGIVKYRQGKTDEAAEYFTVALEKDPAGSEAALYLSTIYRERGEYEKALHLLENASRANPDNVDLLMDLGSMYNIYGLPDKAIHCFRKALIISPKKSELYHNMSRAYRLKRDFDMEKRCLGRAEKLKKGRQTD